MIIQGACDLLLKPSSPHCATGCCPHGHKFSKPKTMHMAMQAVQLWRHVLRRKSSKICIFCPTSMHMNTRAHHLLDISSEVYNIVGLLLSSLLMFDVDVSIPDSHPCREIAFLTEQLAPFGSIASCRALKISKRQFSMRLVMWFCSSAAPSCLLHTFTHANCMHNISGPSWTYCNASNKPMYPATGTRDSSHTVPTGVQKTHPLLTSHELCCRVPLIHSSNSGVCWNTCPYFKVDNLHETIPWWLSEKNRGCARHLPR